MFENAKYTSSKKVTISHNLNDGEKCDQFLKHAMNKYNNY